jgi:hypothetical protein
MAERRSLAYTALAGSLGIALVLLALPQLGAALLSLYAGPEAPAGGEAAMLARAAGLDRADGWFRDPRARTRAGMDEFYAADHAAARGRPDPALLAKAVADLSDGLARAPADATGWAVLAAARRAAGDRAGAVAALEASILLGPYEPELTPLRSELAVTLWPDLDADARRVAGGQVRLAWDTAPQALLALARRPGNALPVLAALAADPIRLTAFMKAAAAAAHR